MTRAKKSGECFVIAEAGVNHNGSLQLAKELIDAAADAGANAVKFQTFKTESLVTRRVEKVKYQGENFPGETQYEMLKKLELSFDDFKVLKGCCDKIGVQFISTPFDEECALFLIEDLGTDVIKIPSGEMTNLPFLSFLSKFNKQIILSTGMSGMSEVERAVEIIKETGFSNELILLHCTSEYPCPFNNVNLRAMLSLKEEFNVRVGYSDHTIGVEVAIAAVALGASVIEKHFTLDREMIGPDHKTSVDPITLKSMISSIRNIESSLGNGTKKPTSAEIETGRLVKKSLVLRRALLAGALIGRDDLIAKRAGGEISPDQFENLVGRKLKNNKDKDEVLFWNDLLENL